MWDGLLLTVVAGVLMGVVAFVVAGTHSFEDHDGDAHVPAEGTP